MVCGQMKTYDFALPLGYCCALSQSMRTVGLQYTSLPLDWAGISSLNQSVQIIVDDFRNWFDRDLLELWDVRICGGHVSRVYLNRKTGVGFVHEFSNAHPIEKYYDEERVKFERRIERFRKLMASAKTVFAAYLELPNHKRLTDVELIAARDALAAKFPHIQFDFAYLYEDPEEKGCREERVADGITAYAFDYRMFLNGQVMHTCRMDVIQQCLSAIARINDRRTDEEKAKFAEFKRRERQSGLGGGSKLRQKINKRLLRWFRTMEEYLESQHIMPGDRPLWFGKG